MKKFFPAAIVGILLFFIAVGQVVFTGNSSKAGLTDYNKKEFAKLENSFHSTTFSDFTGDILKLTDVEKPIVIVNFWASWCTTCLAEFDSLNKFVEKYRDQALVVGVNNDEEDPETKIQKIEDEYNLKFKSFSDKNGEIAKVFNVESFPKTIVFYKGKVLNIFETEVDFLQSDFIREIDNQLSL